VFVDVALKVVEDLLFQRRRSGIPEHADRNLTGVVVPTLDIDEDFDVARLSIARHDAGNPEIRGGFARGFGSNLRDRSNGKAIFNHDCDRYMRSGRARSPVAQEFTRTLRDGRMPVNQGVFTALARRLREQSMETGRKERASFYGCRRAPPALFVTYI
jgi:hypothetical protein